MARREEALERLAAELRSEHKVAVTSSHSRKRTAKQVIDARMRELAGSKPSFVGGLSNAVAAHATGFTPRLLSSAVTVRR
ncbi:hypothetical protein [Mycobacterium sp. EPa45]|uniref:hypothetical protein n=1 Tax=Mycobacterium sp. EPa45 TaxID=1545728 RepID=UPI00191068C9